MKKLGSKKVLLIDPVAALDGQKLTLDDGQEVVVMFSSMEKLQHLVGLLETWTSRPKTCVFVLSKGK